MTLRVSVVVGNPKARSRTLEVGVTFARALLAEGSYELRVVDLVDHAADIFQWPSAELAELNAAVADSDILVIGSPTYKATFTGLLKGFLDRYPANGLEGVVAIPFQTGADATHSLGPQHGLVPLLIELGAIVPAGGFYFVTSRMNSLDEEIATVARRYIGAISRLSSITPSLAAVPEAVAVEGGDR